MDARNVCVALYARESSAGVAAFAAGLAARTIPHVWRRPVPGSIELVPGVTHVVTEGIRGPAGNVHAAYRAIGRDVLILELPRLRASLEVERKQCISSWGMYPNSLHALPMRVGNEAVVWGLLKHPEPREVLVCGQKPGDTAHGMDARACATWARETIALARMQFRKPVTFRPHPSDVLLDPSTAYGADAISHPSKETLRTALHRAWAMVTYNSTSGVDAIDAGVPVYYTAHADVVAYRDYAAPLGAPLRKLTKSERATCLARFAALQWTESQMRDGTAAGCLLLGEPWPEPTVTVLPDPDRIEAARLQVARENLAKGEALRGMVAA
jgi:hypothetical protein